LIFDCKILTIIPVPYQPPNNQQIAMAGTNFYYILTLTIFVSVIAAAMSDDESEVNVGDFQPEFSLTQIDMEDSPSLHRTARGSAGTRQRYKNHPRPRKPHKARHNGGRAYVSNEDAQGYAAILG